MVSALSSSVHAGLLDRPVLVGLWLLNEVLRENMLYHDWLDFGMLEALCF